MSGSPDWAALDSLLDSLLSLSEPEREARLQAIHADDPAQAQALRTCLQSIDASEGWLERRSEAPSQVGPWRVLEQVGRGGMGLVFRGERADGAFERQVAVKFLRRDIAIEAERLASERHVLARLDHPHIARLLDGGVSADGQPWLVMEWADGLPLDAWCSQRKPDLSTRIAVFRQLCAAVAFAHSHLIVHRDLKPANVRVDKADKVKLLDFGIARLLDQGAHSLHTVDHAMTPAYAAPEQFQAAPLSVATDVYALGGILFHLLSGRPRIDVQTQSLRSVVHEVCDVDAPAPSRCSGEGGIRPSLLRGDLDAIVGCALQREPPQRYASVQAMLDDLDAWQQHRPLRARRTPWWDRALRLWRRHRLPASLAMIAVISLLSALLNAQVQAARLAAQRNIALAERDAAQTSAARYSALNSLWVRLFRDRGAQANALTADQWLDTAVQEVLDEVRDAAGVLGDAQRDLLLAMADLQSSRGRPMDALQTLDAVLSVASQLPTDAQARIHCQRASVLFQTGDKERHSEAEANLQRGRELSESLSGTQAEEGAFCLSVAADQLAADDPSQGLALLQLALQRLPSAEHSASLQKRRAELLHRRGNLASLAGDMALALQSYRDAVALTRQWASEDRQGLASSLLGEAGALSSLGQLQDAALAYAEALPLLEASLGESVELATELMNSANVLNTLEQAALARQRIERAQAMLRKLGDVDTGHDGHALLELAKASLTLGEFERALHEAEAAEQAFIETLGADHPYVWFPGFSAARAEQGLGRSAAAQQRIASTLQHYREQDDPGMQLRVLQVEIELALDADQRARALTAAVALQTLIEPMPPSQSLSWHWSQALLAAVRLRWPEADDRSSAQHEQDVRSLDAAAAAMTATLGDAHSRVRRIAAWRAQASPAAQ